MLRAATAAVARIGGPPLLVHVHNGYGTKVAGVCNFISRRPLPGYCNRLRTQPPPATAMPDAPLLAERFAAVWPLAQWQDVPVVLAVSGGADSVALLRLMSTQASGSSAVLHVVHFNHELRGADSLADEQFVADLARSLRLPCHVGRSSRPLTDTTDGDGLEATARNARYEFLCQTAERLGARYVVTAHTADDQAETVLHHALRGTGLAGLAGMPRTRLLSPAVTLIRPLLEFRRRDLENYLVAQSQTWRNDATNDDLKLTRNRIRHELLPLMVERYYPGAIESLLRLGRLAGEAQEVLSTLAEGLAERAKLSSPDPDSLRIDCRVLSSQPPHLVREALVWLWRRQGWPLGDMTWDHWQTLAEVALRGPDGHAMTMPGAIDARRGGETLTFERQQSKGQ